MKKILIICFVIILIIAFVAYVAIVMPLNKCISVADSANVLCFQKQGFDSTKPIAVGDISKISKCLNQYETEKADCYNNIPLIGSYLISSNTS